MAQKTFLVGTISPTNRPESGTREQNLDDLIPAPIRFVSLNMNFTSGTQDEFGAAMPGYEAKAAELAATGADLIRPSGAPPFMMLGYQGEQNTISGWEEKYRVPMFTSGQNHVHALRALGIDRFVGASYFPSALNDVYRTYLEGACFEVLAMEGNDVPFADVPKLPPEQVFEHLTKMAAKHPRAQAIYMLGSAWKTLDIVDRLEQETGLPAIHPTPARCWETQLRLGLHHPMPGYGRLLAEFPE
jgi:maleate isomerase